MDPTTYSFLDSVVILAHPDIPGGVLVLSGSGIGKITITMRDDRTSMDAAADGTVMISKMAGNVGQLQLDLQQTSKAHKDLLALYNILIIADPSSWAKGTITMRNVVEGSGHVATGVAFVKLPDKVYQKDGQHLVWTLLAADVQNLTF